MLGVKVIIEGAPTTTVAPNCAEMWARFGRLLAKQRSSAAQQSVNRCAHCTSRGTTKQKLHTAKLRCIPAAG
jgi:hypothetical protein